MSPTDSTSEGEESDVLFHLQEAERIDTQRRGKDVEVQSHCQACGGVNLTAWAVDGPLCDCKTQDELFDAL